MQLGFENADFTRYLQKQAISRTTVSQLTQIPPASTCFESVHSKHKPV